MKHISSLRQPLFLFFLVSGLSFLFSSESLYAANCDMEMVSAVISPNTGCDSAKLTFTLTFRNNGPDTSHTLLVRLGIFDSTQKTSYRTDTNILIEKALKPGDSIVLVVDNFWKNVPGLATYLYTDVLLISGEIDPVPGNSFVF